MKTRFLLSLFFFTGTLCTAQSIYVVGETLSVGNNTVLYVGDSVVNNGTIINNGDIQVAGFWLNNGTYEPGQGQLTLTSSSPQVINHNDQSFTRLKIEGGGEKIFGADIYIVNELVLSNGNLVSASGSKLVIEDGAVISGGSDNSYIDGPIYHVGTGSKYFPVGSGNVFLPLELVNVTGTSPTVGVLLTLPNTNLGVQGNLEAVSARQYWQLDVIAGSFAGSQVVLPLRDETFLDIIDQAVVAQSPSLGEPFMNLGASARTGDVSLGTVSSEIAATKMFLTVGRFEGEVGGKLVVYNAVSPNDDGMNDFFKILNIDQYPNNIVTIYTRWGDKVFEMAGYDNMDNKFEGQSNVGKSYLLQEGTYYYVVEKGESDDKSDRVSGFLVLRN
jgi:gliding motility-associated-like protein